MVENHKRQTQPNRYSKPNPVKNIKKNFMVKNNKNYLNQKQKSQ